MDNMNKPYIEKDRIIQPAVGKGRDLAQHPTYRGVMPKVGRSKPTQPVEQKSGNDKVGEYGNRTETRLSQSATVVQFGGSGNVINGPSAYLGSSVYATTNAVVLIRDQNNSGTIMQILCVAANTSETTIIPNGLNCNGIYVEVQSGSVIGAIYAAVTE